MVYFLNLVPENIIDYNYKYSYYIIGEEITENEPIITSTKEINYFEINDQLPNGLSLNKTNGIISGKILQNVTPINKKEYIITVIYKDGNKTECSIFITVKSIYKYNIIEDMKPEIVKLIDVRNNTIYNDSNSLIIGLYYILTINIENGYKSHYIIYNLPDDFLFHEDTQEFEGYIHESFNVNLILHLYVTKEKYYEYILPLIANSICKTNERLHLLQIVYTGKYDFSGKFEFKNETDIIFSTKVIKGLYIHEYEFCLPQGLYSISWLDTTEYCGWHFNVSLLTDGYIVFEVKEAYCYKQNYNFTTGIQ